MRIVPTVLLMSAASVALPSCVHRPAASWASCGVAPMFEAGPGETYVFHFLPSFDEESLARVMRGAQGDATAVFLGQSAFDFTCPANAVERPVSGSDWMDLVRRIDEGGFWSDDPPESRHCQLDGNEWILEGIRNGVHRRVMLADCDLGPSLDTPRRNQALKSAMELMMRLSGAPFFWFARS